MFVWMGLKITARMDAVDKSYGHRSGPPHSTPRSVVPLITGDRHPGPAAHTASFIRTDQFTQQPFCSGLGEL